MSAKSITFNSFDLQDSNFRTRDIVYRNTPEKIIDLIPKSRRDGFDLVNTYYENKEITIVGMLTRDTEANLKTSLDLMKAALHIDESNLDINDGGTTMRFVASVKSINVPEEHYHITQIPYEIVFICEPFMKSTSTTTDSKTITQASASPYENTFDPVGSIGPNPVLKWACSGAPMAAITQIVFENVTTGETITVPSLVLDADGDYLEIDCENLTVKRVYDGGAATSIDFTGVFPTFKSTSNSYKVTITGGGATWSLSQTIVYYSTYI